MRSRLSYEEQKLLLIRKNGEIRWLRRQLEGLRQKLDKILDNTYHPGVKSYFKPNRNDFKGGKG